MVTMHRFHAADLRAITQRIFMAAGTPDHIAADVAEILVNANLTGHDSHGILRIPAYLEQIEGGDIVPDAEPEIIKETSNLVVIDGKKGFGHYTARQAMDLAIEKARRADICAVSFAQINHIGRLGEYAEQAAHAGCIGLITVGVGGEGRGCTVPYGGTGRWLGTNPMAAGVPTGDDAPFVLDFATSVVAEGKLQVARSKGDDLPAGYIVDKAGQPSTRTADFYAGGALLTMGRHKGYALSLLFCLLGGLAGPFDAEKNRMGGAFMQVIHVESFTPLAEYQRHVRAFLNGFKASSPAPGFDEVLVPGDMEYCTRTERLAQGIEVPATILSQIREWAAKLKVSLDEL